LAQRAEEMDLAIQLRCRDHWVAGPRIPSQARHHLSPTPEEIGAGKDRANYLADYLPRPRCPSCLVCATRNYRHNPSVKFSLPLKTC